MDDCEKYLWKKARKRVSFKKHLRLYIIVNSFLWAWWLIDNLQHHASLGWSFPWPIYPLIGWGLGLTLHFLSAYSNNNECAVKREYEKLKRSQEKEPNDPPLDL